MAGKLGAKASGASKSAAKTAVALGATVDVVVTVADTHRDNIATVAGRLMAAGLSACQTLTSAGIVIGSVAHASLGALATVAGVKAVEVSGGVQIAPPDADVQ